MRRLVLWSNLVLAGLSSQACVGKFLSNLLSTENAQFKLLEVVPVSNTKILVGFNKPLAYDRGALTLSNYSIPGLNISSVERGPETNQIYLKLDPNDSVRMQQQYYTLTVSGVQNIYWDDLLPGAENRSRQFMGARWLRATCNNDAGTSTCPASGTSMSSDVTVTVRGDYAKGQKYRWALSKWNGSAYVAVTAGLAHSPAAQSPEIDINSTFIVPAAIGTGDFRLETLIQDDAGAWQPASDTTYYLFTVDSTSVQYVGLSNTPAALTSSSVTAINVVFRNCVSAPTYPNGFVLPCHDPNATDFLDKLATETPVSYKYRVGTKAGSVAADCNGGGYTFGAWSAARATNLPIVEVLSVSQCYNIQVIAADNVGNWQCDTSMSDTAPDACLNPSGPGDRSIASFFSGHGTSRTYQESRFLLDNTPPVAVLDTNTLPPATTSATSFAVVVNSLALDSSPLAKYRYRVIGTGFSGVWSADKTPGASGELISGAGLSNGTYRIEIIGKDAAGNYQSTSGLPSQSYWEFTVDTAAPTASIASHANCMGATGLPPNPTNRNCVDIQVNGVTYYKYKWVTGSTCGASGYSAQMTAASDFITTGPAWADGQTYSLCVIGSNNGTLYQGEAETAVTRHTFVYDTTPPVSMIGTWVNPAANLSGKSTVVDQLSVSIAKFSSTQNGTTTSGSAVVTGLTSTTGMIAGMTVSATSGIPNGTKILTVDSATQITLTQNATSSGSLSLTIASEDIQNFKGVITTSACPTAATMVASDITYPITSPQSPLQATGIGTGTVHICFIARDGAGNWETTTHDVSYTRFQPPAPGDGGGASDAQYTSSFNFTWTTGTEIPIGTQKIVIRVCKDSACSNPLPGMNNGKDVCTSVATCDATSSYALNSSCTGLDCIKQVNGANYFAQLKVTDSIGQESTFGPVSNGKVVTGQITGYIRNTFNAPISGATVGVYQSDCTTQIGSDVTSAGDGSFTFSLGGGHSLPILLSANGYCVKATSGSLQGIKKFIESKPGTATAVGTVYAVDTTGTPGCLIGAIVDGSNGSQLILSNATFSLKDYNGTEVASTPSLDPDGKQFVFPSACLNSWGTAPYSSPTYTHSSGVSPGVYTLDVSIPNYYSISEVVSVSTAATTNIGYIPMVGTFSGGSKQIKIILTWNTNAKDLDLHLVGPSSGIDCQPYNEAAIQNATGAKFHVSYQQRYCAETGTYAPTGSTSLAVDDTFEYGPEIINFYDGFANGTYKVSVFNNDATAPNWNTVAARIDVYAGNYFTGGGGKIATVLSTGSSTNRGWKALRLIISGTSLTVDDTTGVGYANWTYGTGTFTCGGTQINGPSDGLTAGAVPSAGSSPADPNLDCGLFTNGTTVASGAGPLDW